MKIINGVAVYTMAEVEAFQVDIAMARGRWAHAAKADYEKNGDRGSCVLGAGLEVYVLPPRCKHPRTHVIISFNEISPCQGENAVSSTAFIAVTELGKAGLVCRYNHGRMD